MQGRHSVRQKPKPHLRNSIGSRQQATMSSMQPSSRALPKHITKPSILTRGTKEKTDLGSTMQIASQQRKREASRVRKATASPAGAAKAKPKPKKATSDADAAGAWPVIRTAPIEARAWQPASASSQAAAVEVKEEDQSQGAYPKLEEPDAVMGNEEK